MTIDEAIAVLGIDRDRLCLEAVERHYREKAKRSHPDRASYPGAAFDFKQATSAYELLKTFIERGGQAAKPEAEAKPQSTGNEPARSELADVLASFRYTISIDQLFVDQGMTRMQRIWALDGLDWNEWPGLEEGDLVRPEHPLMRVTWRNAPIGYADSTLEMLVAPVASRLIRRRYESGYRCHEYTLAPTDKELLAEDLLRQRDLFGVGLAEAAKQVAFDYQCESGGILHPPEGGRSRMEEPEQATAWDELRFWWNRTTYDLGRACRIAANWKRDAWQAFD